MVPDRQQLTIYCQAPKVAPTGTWEGALPAMNEVHVHLADLHELGAFAERHYTLLDAQERERHARFRFAKDQERFLHAHGLLRRILGQYLDHDPALLHFERGAHGKPFLKGFPLHFNLSDTKDALAIAVARHELGVDLETCARTVDHVGVGTHYFTPQEQAGIAQATDGKRHFLELWTRKEAILKASGVGIMDDLKILRVDQARNELFIGHEAFVALAAPAYHVQTWTRGPQHLVSIASSVAFEQASLFQVGP